MKNYICTTCGTQYAASGSAPVHCNICEDERQFVNPDGQQWTTLDKLKVNHRNQFQKKEPGLYGIGTVPEFGIGQRALLVQTKSGNVLWDCISLLDEATIDIINGLGGLEAVAISHPHYYSSMVEWSKAFGDVPVYLHEKDRRWIMRDDGNIQLWNEETYDLNEELTLIRLGGHFDGGTVLHWKNGSNGKGALLSGDILQVVPDRKHVSFMYSYPNQVPLSSETVENMVEKLANYRFDRIYGAWWNRIIEAGAKERVTLSARRYIQHIRSPKQDT